MIKDEGELRRVLGETLNQDGGVIAEHGYVIGVIRGLLAGTGTPAEMLADVRKVVELHGDAMIKHEHGGFSLCPNGCTRCGEVVTATEATWQASMAAQGIELVNVASLPPEERAAAEEEALHQMWADEMDAAAGGPDPDYGKDIDDD